MRLSEKILEYRETKQDGASLLRTQKFAKNERMEISAFKFYKRAFQ